MSNFTPVEKFSDCGNGYGLAMVAGDDGVNRHVHVDLNTEDNSPLPRIVMPDGVSEVVSDRFITAYRALTSRETRDPTAKEIMCRALAEDQPLEPPLVWNPWYLMTGGSLFLSVLSYQTDQSLRPIEGVPHLSETPQRERLFLWRSGFDVSSTLLYQWSERNLNRRVALKVDASLAAAGAGLAVFGAGNGNDAMRYAGTRTFFDAGVPLLRRTLVRTPSGRRNFDIIHGVTGVALVVGTALLCRPPSVSESERYDTPYPADVSGHYGVDGNPYEEGRTGYSVCQDMQMIGLSQAVSAGRSLIWRAFGWED